MHSKSLSLLVALLLASSASARTEWNHNPASDVGPNVWGTLAFPFSTCGSVLPAASGTLPDPAGPFTEVEKRQTPIDIQTAGVVAAALPALAFQYKKAPLAEGGVDTLTTFTAASILPPSASLSHWTYTGSLTTPPCSEGVRWLVLKEPVNVSSQSLAKFRAIVAAFPGQNGWFQNNRPVMPLDGRTVLGR
jgi:carbonic anhydrase